jgi:hypothetical protein
METEHTIPQNYRRSLLASAEPIKAIVEETSEQEVQELASQHQLTDEFSARDLSRPRARNRRSKAEGSPFGRRAVSAGTRQATNIPKRKEDRHDR